MRRLHIIVASNRPGGAGRPVADWFTAHAVAREDLKVTLVDLAEVGLPFFDEPEHPSEGKYVHQHTKDWSALISEAEAVVLVMPMYNGGFGGALKNAIDFLYNEWADKPVGLVSYSAGATGGAPAAEMLKPVLTRLSMPIAEAQVIIPGIDDRLDANRVFLPTPELDEAAGRVLDEIGQLLLKVDESRAEPVA